MTRKSVWAVVAGVLFIVVVTTIIDIVLHVAGVFPPMSQPLTDWQSAIALSYRIVVGIAGAWLTARLAPSRPMKHAIVLGMVGIILGLAGLIATWNAGLGPRWYPIAIVVLAMPQCWAGGRLFELQ